MDLFTDLSADFSIFIRLFHISFLILSSWNTKGNVHCVIKPIWMSYSLQKVRQRPRSGCGTVCCPTPGYCGLRLLLWRVSPGEPMLHVSLLECSVLISSVPTTSPGNISLKVNMLGYCSCFDGILGKNSTFNPILTGLFESKFLLGGGGGSIWPPLQISAPKGPIAAKFCMDVKTHLKSISTEKKLPKTVYLLYYYNLCKWDAC